MDVSPGHPLPLTGERTLPGVADEAYWFARHVVAYELAARRVDGLGVLDAGCGEGYGLRLLADAGAHRVVGADYDAATVAHAAATYAAVDPRIEVVHCELLSLPLDDDEVDLTVSLQVIEHVHDVAGYLDSLRRVTRPGGMLVIATPNRLTFTPDSDTPVNPFHVTEFTALELRRALEASGLVVDRVLGVHHGRRLAAAEEAWGASLPDLQSAGDPAAWDDDLRAHVRSVQPADFELRPDRLDDSLDLVALAHVP